MNDGSTTYGSTLVSSHHVHRSHLDLGLFASRQTHICLPSWYDALFRRCLKQQPSARKRSVRQPMSCIVRPTRLNGIILSVMMGGSGLFLVLVLPFVIKYSRIFYAKYAMRRDMELTAQEIARGTDTMLIVASDIMDALGIVMIGLSKTTYGVLAAAIVMSFAAGGHPTVNSPLVASVHHTQSDGILAANAMLESAGQVPPLSCWAASSPRQPTHSPASSFTSAHPSPSSRAAVSSSSELWTNRLGAFTATTTPTNSLHQLQLHNSSDSTFYPIVTPTTMQLNYACAKDAHEGFVSVITIVLIIRRYAEVL